VVIPAMARVAVVELATEQDTPLKVMVTVVPVAEALAVQLVNPLPKVTVGEAGTEKAELKTTVMVSPAPNAPAEPVLNPAVQVAVAAAVWGEPAKVTFVSLLAMDTAEAGLAAAVSIEVFTLNVLPV
jgi:hypothetical protein